MNSFSGKLLNIFISRWTRNVLFWVGLLYLVNNNDTANRVYQPKVYFVGMAITTAVMMLYTYANNLWLMPKFVRTKRYKSYVWRVLLLTVFCAALFIGGVKMYFLKYPLISIHHISLFSTPVSLSYTVDEIVYELFYCATGMLLWLFLLSTAWYMNDYYRQQKALEAVQRKHVEAELHFLKTQVNPHFLFNTLNNLYGLSLKKADTTPDAILRLSSILRYMLYESDAERVSFEKEKEIMQAYINLELLRLPPSDNYVFEIAADNDYLLPPLLWLPLLENVFKHATRVIADKYFIEYRATIKNGELIIYTRNNYKANGTVSTEGGIGLANLRKRLKLLYPGKHSITSQPDGDAFVVELKVSL